MRKQFLAAALTVSIFLLILLVITAVITPLKISAIMSQSQAENDTKQLQEDQKEVIFSQRTADIAILGPDGFDRSGHTAQINEEITFHNLNTKEYPAKQTVVIMIQNDDDQFDFVNSPKIRFNQTWSITFDQPAEYTLWAVGHDVEIPLIIRE